jgi:hypothetical protein
MNDLKIGMADARRGSSTTMEIGLFCENLWINVRGDAILQQDGSKHNCSVVPTPNLVVLLLRQVNGLPRRRAHRLTGWVHEHSRKEIR